MKKLKLLIITTHPLIPRNWGYPNRFYYFLRFLKSKGHIVDLLSFCSSKELLYLNKNKSELNEICSNFFSIYINRKYAYLNCLKACFTNHSFKAEYYNFPQAIKKIKKIVYQNDYEYICGCMYSTSQFLDLFPQKKRWLDYCDSIYMLYKRRLKNTKNILQKIFLMLEIKRVYNIEVNASKKYDLLTIISDIDKNEISLRNDNNNIQVLPNGVEIPKDISIEYNKNEIVYMGDMAYVQNQDAVEWFIKNILPELILQKPDIIFKIVGKNPKMKLYDLCKGNKNIIITGEVDDVRREIMKSNFMVCPIRISSGRQTKILESMSVGVPVIASYSVAKPITLDKNILLTADSVDEWIKQIIYLMDNKEKRRKLSVNSKKFAIDNFDWLQCSKRLEDLLLLN